MCVCSLFALWRFVFHWYSIWEPGCVHVMLKCTPLRTRQEDDTRNTGLCSIAATPSPSSSSSSRAHGHSLPELRKAATLLDFSRGQRDPLFTCGEGDSLDSIISTQDNSEDDHKDARYSAGEDTGDIKHQRISGYMMET